MDTITDSEIIVRGAREHNLANLNLELPRNKITVITGLSGSGKSSLAFDTLYAEGQRRYVESLSSYARQFLEQLKKPDVDSISGLSPAISIEQKTTSTSPRSTVGTVTEIYDFMRLLFARAGQVHCYNCQKPITQQTTDQILQQILSYKDGTRLHVLSPIIRGKKGEYLAEFKKWLKMGFVRARVDGIILELSEAKKLEKTKSHDIDLFIDRLVLKEGISPRLREAVDNALSMADGYLKIELVDEKKILTFSTSNACVDCGISYPEIEPRLFSFNNPRGACPECKGLGYIEDEENEPSTNPDDEEKANIQKRVVCAKCSGNRLKPEALSVFIGGKNIQTLSRLTGRELFDFFGDIKFTEKDLLVVGKVVKEIKERLAFLQKVGVDYLSLDRTARTLSGGESQRIRLATQIGNSLIGILYVLDEPSIGLHPRDHHRLLEALRQLCDLGNTVVLVEHDADTINSADHIIDLGPGAGRLGGKIMALGTPKQIMREAGSLTGNYLSGKKQIPVPKARRLGDGRHLKLEGATGNNLKKASLQIPLGTMTAVTGVSGCGKSTLIVDTLLAALRKSLYDNPIDPLPYNSLSGIEFLDSVVDIDQSPIGRTPRSNPATYTGVFTLIRSLFSELQDSKVRGYKQGHFSFNVKGGRCEACEGNGMLRVEMHFLPDVYVTCDTCQGKRFNREVLDIKYKDKSIADVLALEVKDALTFFERIPTIRSKLETLDSVGLGYLTLGQSSTTLSGGEAQRVKLSKELYKRQSRHTLYVLDEPTTGLHFEDIRKLLEILKTLVDAGNTVLVIEHNLEVVKSADHVIDMGPEGGVLGGQVVAAGTPEEIASTPHSWTGQYLKKLLVR